MNIFFQSFRPTKAVALSMSIIWWSSSVSGTNRASDLPPSPAESASHRVSAHYTLSSKLYKVGKTTLKVPPMYLGDSPSNKPDPHITEVKRLYFEFSISEDGTVGPPRQLGQHSVPLGSFHEINGIEVAAGYVNWMEESAKPSGSYATPEDNFENMLTYGLLGPMTGTNESGVISYEKPPINDGERGEFTRWSYFISKDMSDRQFFARCDEKGPKSFQKKYPDMCVSHIWFPASSTVLEAHINTRLAQKLPAIVEGLNSLISSWRVDERMP